MRIGIDVREFVHKSNTGIARYLRDFLSYVFFQKKTDHEFILFGNQTTDIPFESKYYKKVIIPEKVTVWWDQVQLPQYIKKEGVELFVTPYYKAPIYTPCLLVPIINDLIPILHASYQTNILRRFYYELLVGVTIKRANCIITISHHAQKDIHKVFGVSRKKIKVITLAVDQRFRPGFSHHDKILAKYKIKGKFIFYFGNFNPHKNIASLVKAYALLPVKIQEDYHLVIGGKPNKYSQNVLEIVDHLALQDRIVFTGFVDDEDLPTLYSAADLFVFPSFYEGFGLPPLESMACGTPVIVSNTTSLPEVIDDAGLLIDPNDIGSIKDAIVQVLSDETLKLELCQKGLERAKEFTPQKTGEQILTILEQVSRLQKTS